MIPDASRALGKPVYELLGGAVRVDGQIPLPAKPGLGVELNRDALAKFKEYADQKPTLR